MYFLIGAPVFDEVTDPYCSEEWFRPLFAIPDKCFIDRNQYERGRDQFIESISQELIGLDVIFISDYLHLICDTQTCNAGRYFDDDHFIDDLSYEILEFYNFNDLFKKQKSITNEI